MKIKMSTHKMTKYWYIMHIWECPLCGHQKIYRERVYTQPTPEEKYQFNTIAYHCGY